MKLLVQPDDGAAPLLDAIEGARSSIDMYIFRLSYPAVEEALADAVRRGVVVRTLIAHLNGSGDEALRKLELRLLGLGATVSRTDEDLLRYHGKMMIVDRKTLYVLGYNFNRKDIERSRSLGVATRQPDLVSEGLRLFQADFDRKVYTPGNDRFVVSPLNSRAAFLELIEGAREQLLIYDSRLSDNQVQGVIERQAMKGVEVRVIGKVEKRLREVSVRRYGADRLHVRAIVRDAHRVFIGSQSLRRAELERRREIGIIFDDQEIAKQIATIFDEDWAAGSGGKRKGASRARG
ncbi:MAG TPA: phospholipase D-like domain-containing protein [Gemmatimonadales bacterium]|nr:phospholipase D-like domain-containing protein [Gemmatimonadales bacterium]